MTVLPDCLMGAEKEKKQKHLGFMGKEKKQKHLGFMGRCILTCVV